MAIMMSKEAEMSLINWTPVNKRILKARFFSKHIKMTVIQAYAEDIHKHDLNISGVW